MYEVDDPRSKLKSDAASAAPKVSGYAAAEYVRFGATPPAMDEQGARTWLARGQNFVLAYSEVQAGSVLRRERHTDEYMAVIPAAGEGAQLAANDETATVSGYSLIIMPPGDSAIRMRQSGLVLRVFSTCNADLASRAANAHAYSEAHPHIPPFKPWPAPPAGFRIRHYSLDVPAQPGRFGRIFRCTTMMINMLPLEHGPRDITRLSPHHHDDFEQGSLAIEGAFTHHIRWPWTANQHNWRNDDHEHCAAPSLAVIPPPAIHTSAATEPHRNQLIDIFSPPRVDFSKMNGWVLNADEYPMAAE
jgi:hypothetical protein